MKDLIDNECEKAICASIMVHGARFFDEIGSRVRTEHFGSFFGRTIFELTNTMYSESQQIELLAVTHRLTQMGQITQLGGPAAVTELIYMESPLSACEYWVEKLIQNHQLRKIQNVLKWAESEIQRPTETFSQDFESKVLALAEVETKEDKAPDAIKCVQEEIQGLLDGRVEKTKKTMIPSWDYTLNGLTDGRMYALGARAGRGKTAMMEQMITSLMLQDCPVLVFEKDMSPEMLLKRMACRMAQVSFKDFEHRKLSHDQLRLVRDAIEEYQNYPLYIYSPERLTGADIRAIVRREKRRKGIKAVFLDHIQLLDTGKDIRESLTASSIQIRLSSTENNIPHVVIAQLNRNAKDGQRPSASDIKEFDQLYADCDVMALLWSEDQKFDVTGHMSVNFTLVKNRYGPTCEDKMRFYGKLMEFKKHL